MSVDGQEKCGKELDRTVACMSGMPASIEHIGPSSLFQHRASQTYVTYFSVRVCVFFLIIIFSSNLSGIHAFCMCLDLVKVLLAQLLVAYGLTCINAFVLFTSRGRKGPRFFSGQMDGSWNGCALWSWQNMHLTYEAVVCMGP